MNPYQSSEYISNLKGPTCGSLTFNVFHDDGFNFEIDGTPIISLLNSGNVWGTRSFGWTSELNKLYPIRIQHRNGGGPTGLQFSWTFSTRTCHGVVVPGYSGIINGTNWYSDIIVFGNIPYNITVSCPDGYEQDSATGKCVEVPGNGFRTGSEV